MRSNFYLLNNRRLSARVTAIGTGLLGVLALSVAVASAQLPEKPSQAIPAYAVKRAEAEGLSWVMVDLNVSVSLEDLKTKKKEKEIKDKEQALCAYLNVPTDKKGGFLSNGFGQVQLLLTPGELGRLAKAGSLIKAIHEDTTEDLRRSVSNDDGRLAAIKEKILRYGYAKVRLHRFYSEPEDMDIDLKQFYLLKEADDVRAMYLHGWNPTGTTVDPEALATARQNGYADVLVALRPPLDYTAMIGKTPKAQWDEQAWKLHELFEKVLVSVQFEEISGFPIAHVPHFPLALLKNPPAGIAAIALNRTFSPMLVQSEALINMPRAWNIGADGTGQNMVVLDTGVDKTHPFFSNRVVFEACYGTDNLSYTSICPLKDALGDSPVGLAGSGMPKANDPLFYHGTHVAGIAAGKSSTMSGVAPSAPIIAVQVFSASKTAGVAPQAYSNDILAALNLANTVTADNFTINMSLGGGINTVGCNSYPVQAVTFQPVIDGLSSKKIPVIAATGNVITGGYGGGIAFPACLDKVIKVSAVNDITGQYSSTYANIDRKADLMGQLLLAPGDWITSSVPGGGYAEWRGTSMAAPHVAGLYAAFKEVVPGVSIQEITNWIVANGVQTLVQNSNVPPGEAPLNEYFPRINIPVL